MTRLGGVARCALVVMLVVAAACSDADDDASSGGGNGSGGGGDASSADRDAYVDKLASSLDDGQLSKDERQCFARSLVDTVGVDTMKEKVDLDKIDANFTPTDFGITIDKDQGDKFYDQLSDCVDVRALFLESLSAGQQLPEETMKCLEDNIDDELVKNIIVASFTEGAAAADDPQLAEQMNAISSECAPAAGG